MSSVTVDIDRFAASVEDVLKRDFTGCEEEVGKAVQKSARRTARKLRGEFTNGIGVHKWSDEYRGGFSSHTQRNGHETVGEVGNKAKPGLVHLLEDGHATPTGRRTRAFKHMEPAFEDEQEYFAEEAVKAIDRALGG